jgi:hypothetical protein
VKIGMTGKTNVVKRFSRFKVAFATAALWLMVSSHFAFAAMQIEVRSRNTAVTSYVNTHLKEDILKAKPMAEAIAGFSLNEVYNDLTIVVTDAEPSSGYNGDQVLYTSNIGIQVDPSPSQYGVREFKDAFFHEFGHLIFQQYLQRHSSATLVMANLQLQYVMPNQSQDADLPYGYFEEIERFNHMQAIVMPFHELFADIFKLMVLKTEAKTSIEYTFYPFAWLESWENGDTHHALDITRNFIWNKWLTPNLNDQNKIISGGQIILKVLSDDIDRLTQPCKYDPECSFVPLKVNSDLLSILAGRLN